MARWTLFVLSGVAAMLAAGLFVYGFLLRIGQTSSPEAETWTPILWGAALILFIAGLFRRR